MLFLPYAEAKKLHFERLDVAQNFAELPIKGTLIVFANYVFDAIAHDAFAISNGEIKPLTTAIAHPPEQLEQLELQFETAATDAMPYDNPCWNAILAQYAEQFIDTHVLLPVGALQLIAQCASCADNMLFFVTDKGYADTKELDNLTKPELTFHGCFSMMANLDAVGRYFALQGGGSCVPSLRPGIKTALFYSKAVQLKSNLRQAIAQHVEGFNPADYFMLYQNAVSQKSHSDLNALLAMCALSHWDPYLFHHLRDAIVDKLTVVDSVALDYFARSLATIGTTIFLFAAGSGYVI